MRTGFATSACAAAAAAAALTGLVQERPLASISIDLPALKNVVFALARCERQTGGVCCGVLKDAGDDPDVTDGLEIQAVVRRLPGAGLILAGGTGIGRVTLPGLPVAVGEAAINPGPRRLIMQVFKRQMVQLQLNPDEGFEIELCVPRGEEIARLTMNPRLGVLGGISILGTDGLVRPYSLPAFRTSLFYELRVAYEKGHRRVALATGKRSALYLSELLQETDGLGILDVGDELAYPIDQALKLGFNCITVGGMIGKLSKLAQGRFQTHVQEGEVDFDFLASLALKSGAEAALCEQIRQARTAHRVQKWLDEAGLPIEPFIAALAAEQLFLRVNRQVPVRVYVFSLNGRLLGQGGIDA
ncbi:MAG: cobalt-precorrin-5B (C(1))-methyltransferase [Anaerolineae bacterium]|nr:cobalt-precorrin-5B (C(1))-methyltransferase [Anaerolineae bacterium]